VGFNSAFKGLNSALIGMSGQFHTQWLLFLWGKYTAPIEHEAGLAEKPV